MDKLVKSIKSDVLKAMTDKMDTVEDKMTTVEDKIMTTVTTVEDKIMTTVTTVQEKMNALEKKNAEQFAQLLKILGAEKPAELQKSPSIEENK